MEGEDHLHRQQRQPRDDGSFAEVGMSYLAGMSKEYGMNWRLEYGDDKI